MKTTTAKQIAIIEKSIASLFKDFRKVESYVGKLKGSSFYDIKVLGLSVEQIDYLDKFYKNTTGKDIRENESKENETQTKNEEL